MPVRMAAIKKEKKWQVLTRIGRRGNPCTLWWEYEWMQPPWKTVWRFLKKFKKSHYHVNPVIPLLDINPKEMKSISWKDICTPVFTAAVFTMAKIWKPCKSPSASQVVLVVKNPPAKAGGAGDVSSIPGLGRCPGGGNGNHFSILAWRIPKTEEQSQTQLKWLSTSIESPLVDKWIKEMWLKNITQLILFRNRRKSCHLWQHGWNLRALY